ncbi:peptide ABC transporter substrate-binding protein [Desemzia sp. RIT804]|uniref:peptide ABC transporter substrate-binding protein n=1 Tax=Desemzia sp. RIT 804 TaxID=2810209 RepID=UPI001950FD70|nr:peptide ABC transporter substrate-binding protein [Desemzia sp. RIT 804]MBM6613449.1 peptide ABC transporter substrate-binding protein [Desemzia sp. RIT 804]
MKRREHTKKLIGTLLAAIFFLGACQKETGNPYLTEEYTEKQNNQNILNLTETSEIPTMDSVRQRDMVSGNVMNNVFEGLYRQAEDGEIVLGMAADEPAISEDGLTYSFKLKENAIWSNGDPVTAQDFVFAWRRLVDPETKALGTHLIEDIVQNASEILAGEIKPTELGVAALDDKTLEIQLVKPITYFSNLLTLPVFFPQNEQFVTEMGYDYATSSETLLYNGPFTLKEWDGTGLSWIYQKNEQYWDKNAVPLKTINVDVIKETYTAINLYNNGLVDQIMLTGEFIELERNHPELAYIPTSSVYYLKFNQEKNGSPTPLENKNIRQAIAKAIDKSGFVEDVLQNGSIEADGLVPEGFAFDPENGIDFRKQSGHLLSYDMQEAVAHFRLGLEELGVDSISLEIIGDDTQIGRESLVYLQNNLMNALPGLELTISNKPFYARLAADEEQNYDIQLAGWGADFADPINFLGLFTTGNGNNKTGFSSEYYDSLIETAEKVETNENERWNLLLQAEEELMKEAIIAPVYQEYKAVLQKEKVKGIISHTVGAEYTYKWADIVN